MILATDAWTQKADFGGKARSQAVGFSIGNKGYLGYRWMILAAIITISGNMILLPTTGHGKQTLGEQRERAAGFSIGNKGYW